jgi:predicted phage terminase large subunit-like protein
MSISAPAISTRLTAEKIANLREKVERLNLTEARERYEDNLSEFVRGAWSSIDSSTYQECWVNDAICDHLESVTYGDIKRFLCNVPPRTGKTSIISIIYPAWVWARSDISYLSGPQVKFLCASYDHKLSLDISNKARRLFHSPWFQKHWPNKIILQGDQNTKHQYDNTAGGSRIATSVSGGLLGIGGDILIADDLNNTEVVESEAERSKVKTFWDEFHTTRLNNQREGAIVVVQQRTHVGDVSGLILDGQEEFVHMCVPMRHDERRHCVTVRLPQYDDDQPWEDPRTYEGELMWPERFNDAEIRRMETGLGPFLAAGRLQQSPTPKGGGILKRDWWQYWSASEASRYHLEWSQSLREFPPFELVIGSLDTAYKEKEENDFNALVILGVWNDINRNRKAMLMYSWAKRLPLHGKNVEQIQGEGKLQFQQRQKEEWGLVEWIADTCKKYKVRRLLIEDKSRGVDVANELNRLYARNDWGTELVNPVRDKVSRAHSVVPMFADSMIWAPAGPNSNGFFTKWADEVITQCENFPKDDHDDLVDAVVQALLWMRESGILLRTDEMSAALEDEMAYRPKTASVAESYGV